MTAYSGTLEGTDGSKLVINNAVVVPAPAPPPPAPGPVDPIPAGANAVRIGTRTYPLAGVNPTTASNPAGAGFPGVRGRDQLILCRPPWSRSGTNRYGSEVPVVAGRLAGPVTVGGTGGIAIPTDGYVLSGHGAADAFLQSAFGLGVAVEVLHADVPAPDPKPDPRPTTGRPSNIAVWVMMWPNSPRFDWASVPDEVDEVRLAFLVNAGTPVGDGPWGLAELRKALAAFLGKRSGRFVSFSMGGGGYEVSIPSVEAYVSAVKAAEQRWLVDKDGRPFARFEGGNVDWESSRFKADGDQVAAVLRALKVERSEFFCSWSPNSSFRDDYAEVCRRNLDVVDSLGYQCYDIPGLTYTGGVHPNVQEVYRDKFLGVGIPANKLEIAMMAEPGRNDRWTVEQCVDAAGRVKAEFGVGRTAFWQAGRPEFPAWAQAMRQVNP